MQALVSGRAPGYEKKTDAEMQKIRRDEQIAAADEGRYASTVQLGFESADIKGMETGNLQAAGQVRAALKEIIDHTPKLKKLYLQSIFDAHDTHHALTMLSLEAVRMLDVKKRPEKCYGVEVSSSLSWLPAEHRMPLKC